MRIELEYLKKKGGARFLDVETYKASCLKNEIIAQKTLKSANEVTSKGEEDEFVHVVKSVLTKHSQPIVVKVHHANKMFVTNELLIMERLKSYKHVVQQLCNFICKDDTKRWMEHIKKPTTLCEPNGPNNLHYIVMEYVENGDIQAWFRSNPSYETIKSFFLQTALVIAELAFTYRVNHGDLNSGNILIERTTKTTANYKVKDKVFRIKTNYVLPKFIDFGRGDIYEGNIHQKEVLTDICLMLTVLCNGIQDKDSKQKLEDFVFEENKRKKNTIIKFIKRLAEL